MKIDPNDTITVTMPRGEAILVGQTLRTLARHDGKLPPGVDRALFTSVGSLLASAALQPRKEQP